MNNNIVDRVVDVDSVELFEYRSFSITTFDNPFNPFVDFHSWFLFDCEKQYYSLNKLARLTHVDESMSSKEEAIEIERAINRLIEIDPLGIYMKIYKPGFEPDRNTDLTDLKGSTSI